MDNLGTDVDVQTLAIVEIWIIISKKAIFVRSDVQHGMQLGQQKGKYPPTHLDSGA